VIRFYIEVIQEVIANRVTGTLPSALLGLQVKFKAFRKIIMGMVLDIANSVATSPERISPDADL
jgi:hypothetical protein